MEDTKTNMKEDNMIKNHEKRFTDIEIVITAREWFETQSCDLPNPMELLSSEELEEIHWHYLYIWIKKYRAKADRMIVGYISEIEYPSLDSISVALKLDSIIVRSESHPTIEASFCLIKFEEDRKGYGIQEQLSRLRMEKYLYAREMEIQNIMDEQCLSREEALLYQIRSINEQLKEKNEQLKENIVDGGK